MQTLKNPRFEVKIDGKWRKVLGVNYHGYEPTVEFLGEPGKGWSLNTHGEKEYFESRVVCYGWPLKDIELRLTK